MFDANIARDFIVGWIREWFEENGKGCNAVVGISGGKDSTVVAALCVQALGKDRVFGVLMPNDTQSDIDVAYAVCKHLGIKYTTCNIKDAVQGVRFNLKDCVCDLIGTPTITDQTLINLPARIRMATLYAISQSVNGRVANTCNLSEDWIGYATRYGDGAGDFSPLSNYTVTEVKAIGKALELPDEFVYKVPTDGLCGKTDEMNLGFSYDILDKYIRIGICDDIEIKTKINKLHKNNEFKLKVMDSCPAYGFVDYII